MPKNQRITLCRSSKDFMDLKRLSGESTRASIGLSIHGTEKDLFVSTLECLKRGYYPTKKEHLLLTKGGSLLSDDAVEYREVILRAWFKDHYDGVTPINFDTLLVEEEVAISEALADLRRFDTPKERTQYWAER